MRADVREQLQGIVDTVRPRIFLEVLRSRMRIAALHNSMRHTWSKALTGAMKIMADLIEHSASVVFVGDIGSTFALTRHRSTGPMCVAVPARRQRRISAKSQCGHARTHQRYAQSRPWFVSAHEGCRLRKVSAITNYLTRTNVPAVGIYPGEDTLVILSRKLMQVCQVLEDTQRFQVLTIQPTLPNAASVSRGAF